MLKVGNLGHYVINESSVIEQHAKTAVAQCAKMALMQFADSTGPDQPAY